MWKRKKKNKRKRSFSLLEISLSLSILGMLATVLSWQTRDFYLSHQFKEEMKSLVIDVRQMQSLALSHHTDFELSFDYDKVTNKWSYSYSTDEPIPYYSRNEKIPLSSVKALLLENGKLAPHSISIYSSGRFKPAVVLCFEGKKGKYHLDLSASPQIKLKEM